MNYDINSIMARFVARHSNGDNLTATIIVEATDLDEDNSALHKWAVATGIANMKEIERAVAQVRRARGIVEALGAMPNCAQDFVTLYMQAIGASAEANGSMRWYDAKAGREADTDIVEQTRFVILANDRLKANFNREVLKIAVDQWLSDRMAERIPTIRSTLTFDVSASFDWKALVTAAFNVMDTSAALTEATLKKFVYDVKRKLAGLVVTNHLMPVLVGAQGGGKSTLIHALTAPVVELSREANFQRLTDLREIDLWKSYVLFIDEMGFATKADIDVVKNVITAPRLDRRPLHTNRSVAVRNCATLIGASNKQLGQLIRDETGNRRFVELQFSPDPDRAALNAMDFGAAWRSIDETGVDPIVAHLDELKKVQESYRQRSTVEEWLDSIDERAGAKILDKIGTDGNGRCKIGRKETVHGVYRQWRIDQEANPRFTLECQDFHNELVRLSNANPDEVKFARARSGSFNGWRYVGPSHRLTLVK